MGLAFPLTWKRKGLTCSVWVHAIRGQVVELCVWITMSPTIASSICMNISMYVHSTTYVVTSEPVISRCGGQLPSLLCPCSEAHSCLLQPWSVMHAACCFGELLNVNFSSYYLLYEEARTGK